MCVFGRVEALPALVALSAPVRQTLRAEVNNKNDEGPSARGASKTASTDSFKETHSILLVFIFTLCGNFEGFVCLGIFATI